jgi:hypothetical protein
MSHIDSFRYGSRTPFASHIETHWDIILVSFFFFSSYSEKGGSTNDKAVRPVWLMPGISHSVRFHGYANPEDFPAHTPVAMLSGVADA